LRDDPDPLPERWSKEGRQFAVMNLKGEYAAYTGPKATEWAGNRSGKFATAQGNILAGAAVVDNMIAAFEKIGGHLSQRLVAARGAQRPGGDRPHVVVRVGDQAGRPHQQPAVLGFRLDREDQRRRRVVAQLLEHVPTALVVRRLQRHERGVGARDRVAVALVF